MNALLIESYGNPAHTLWLIEEAHRRGIGVIQTVGNPLNAQWDAPWPTKNPAWSTWSRVYHHPAVIAYKVGDEPTAEAIPTLQRWYASLRHAMEQGDIPTHPIITAVIGENIAGTSTDYVETVWHELQTDLKAIRFYPIRKEYNLLSTAWSQEKLTLAPSLAYGAFEAGNQGGPWWLINQTFGSPNSYWRVPTAVEVNAMSHLGLAHGSDGLIGYALQTHGANLSLLTSDGQPRVARDGSVPLDQLSLISRHTQTFRNYLLRHQAAEFAVESQDVEVDAIARLDPLTGNQFIYLINRDTEGSRTANIVFDHLPGTLYLLDLYANDNQNKVEPVTAVPNLPGKLQKSYVLQAGEGKLLWINNSGLQMGGVSGYSSNPAVSFRARQDTAAGKKYIGVYNSAEQTMSTNLFFAVPGAAAVKLVNYTFPAAVAPHNVSATPDGRFVATLSVPAKTHFWLEVIDLQEYGGLSATSTPVTHPDTQPVDPNTVWLRPRQDSATGQKYLWAYNQDRVNPVTVAIRVRSDSPLTMTNDLFDAFALRDDVVFSEVTIDGQRWWEATITMAAHEERLWKLTQYTASTLD